LVLLKQLVIAVAPATEFGNPDGHAWKLVPLPNEFARARHPPLPFASPFAPHPQSVAPAEQLVQFATPAAAFVPGAQAAVDVLQVFAATLHPDVFGWNR